MTSLTVATGRAEPADRTKRSRRPAWAGFVMALAVLGLPDPVGSQVAFGGPVVSVIDGDTLVVRRNGERYRLEIEGVDCPESDQAFGSEASALTSRLALGESVRVTVTGKTPGGEPVARVTLADGRNLDVVLVKAGLCWAVPRADGERSLLLDLLQSEARTAHRGLWSVPDPVPPWRHRGEAPPPKPKPVAPPARRPAAAPQALVPRSRSCIDRSRCCKVCTTGQACGNACISARYTCHQGRGCACDSYEICDGSER